MVLQGDVVNVSEEDRELVDKNGVKKTSHIVHIGLLVVGADKSVEVLNVRAYDPSFEVPKLGTKGWITPRIKKYECFDGFVASLMV